MDHAKNPNADRAKEFNHELSAHSMDSAPGAVSGFVDKKSASKVSGSRVKMLSFYIVTYEQIPFDEPDPEASGNSKTVEPKVIPKEFNGIAAAYDAAIRRVKKLKDQGIEMQRGGVRGVGRRWDAISNGVRYSVSIIREKRPANSEEDPK